MACRFDSCSRRLGRNTMSQTAKIFVKDFDVGIVEKEIHGVEEVHTQSPAMIDEGGWVVFKKEVGKAQFRSEEIAGYDLI